MRVRITAINVFALTPVEQLASSVNWLAAPEFLYRKPHAREGKKQLPHKRPLARHKKVIPVARLLGAQSRHRYAGRGRNS